MADNVLRIVFEGGGGDGGGDESGSVQSNRKRRSKEFDPVQSAHDRMERENQQAATNREYNRLRYGTTNNVLIGAAKRLEDEQRTAMQKEQEIGVNEEVNRQKYGSLAGGALNMAGRIGRAGMALAPIGAAAGLAVGAIYAANRFTSNIADRVQQTGMSPQVAMAGASRQVTEMQTSMREAQTLGPALANYMIAQTKSTEEIQKLLLPMKKVVVEVMADAMAIIAVIIQEVRDHFLGPDKANQEDGITAFVQEFLDIGVPGKDQILAAGGNLANPGIRALGGAAVGLKRGGPRWGEQRLPNGNWRRNW